MLTSIAAGLVTMRLMLNCQKKSADMYIAAASGASYIASKLITIQGFESVMKKNEDIKIDETGEADSAQVESLKAQKSSYEEIESTANKKIKLQGAAAAGYTLAAVLALVKHIKSSAMAKGCMAQLDATMKGLLALPDPSMTSKAAAAACGKAITTVAGTEAYKAAVLDSKTQSAQLTLASTEIGAESAVCGSSAACGPYVGDNVKELAICVPVTITSNTHSKIVTIQRNS